METGGFLLTRFLFWVWVGDMRQKVPILKVKAVPSPGPTDTFRYHRETPDNIAIYRITMRFF